MQVRVAEEDGDRRGRAHPSTAARSQATSAVPNLGSKGRDILEPSPRIPEPILGLVQLMLNLAAFAKPCAAYEQPNVSVERKLGEESRFVVA
jgi:hypothetical protein